MVVTGINRDEQASRWLRWPGFAAQSVHGSEQVREVSRPSEIFDVMVGEDGGRLAGSQVEGRGV